MPPPPPPPSPAKPLYPSLLHPWSAHPTAAELLYRQSGFLRTSGTLFLLPPPLSTLRSTFSAHPRSRSRLSAGAVALCKHVERSGYSSEPGRGTGRHPFWEGERNGGRGVVKGTSNEEKDRVAGEILEEILGQAVWRNVIWLHRGTAVYEVRNGRGWGMRWTLEVEKVGQGEGEEGEGMREAGDEGVVDGQGKKEEEDGEQGEQLEGWRIKKTTFRGFLEPIEGLDHELLP